MKADNIVHIYASLETKCLVVRFFRLSLFIAVEMLLLTVYPSRIPGVTLSLLLMSMMLILVIVCCCCCFFMLLLLLFLNFVFVLLLLLFCLLFCLISVPCAQCRLCPWNVHFWLSLHTERHVQSRRYRIRSSGM